MASSSDRGESERKRVRGWQERVAAATKLYEAWEERFEVKALEEYREGYQWRGKTRDEAKALYMVNLFYGAIEAEKPALVFTTPEYRCRARPSVGDDIGSQAQELALLCQDTIQSIVDDRQTEFALNVGLALDQAYTRFGVVEVGYTADYVDNPQADKPVIKPDSEEPVVGEDGAAVTQPKFLLREGSEQFYVRQIPASQFRVSISDRNSIQSNDWVGYYEYQRLEDLQANPVYKNTKTLKATANLDKKLSDLFSDATDDAKSKWGLVKVWKVWDLRARTRCVFADGNDKFLLEGQPWSVFPFALLKFHERTKDAGSWLPVPVTWNWLVPQDELNEEAEADRVHRRRFKRRYTVSANSIDATERDKVLFGEDGACAEDKMQPGTTASPFKPVPDASLDASHWRAESKAREHFALVAGVTGEARGVPEATTATQASITDTRLRMRESAMRVKVGAWLGEIGSILLATVREHLQDAKVIRRSVDLTGPNALAEAVRVAGLWQQITRRDLGELAMDVTVELAMMSPVTQDVQRQTFMEVLGLVANPGMAVLFASSEALLRRVLLLHGIRDDAEVQEIKAACTLLATMMAGQAGASGPSTPQAVVPGPGAPGVPTLPASTGLGM